MLTNKAKLIFLLVVTVIWLSSIAGAFSAGMERDKGIYGVPKSGWKSHAWNWGSAVGTGHDCARICRQNYGTLEARKALVANLMASAEIPADFEEVKLVLALAWQRGRWDGSDGGRGGYGDVLKYMAEAKRYEEGSEEECSVRLVQDMQARYDLLRPTTGQITAMQNLNGDCESDVFIARRRCAGLVLEAMGFVENGC